MDIKLKEDEVLVLVAENRETGYKLPESGLVESDEPIEGLLWGYGNNEEHALIRINNRKVEDKYIIVKVNKEHLTANINDPYSVRFSKGETLFCGSWPKVITILQPYWFAGVSKDIKMTTTIGNKCHSYAEEDRESSYTSGINSHSLTTGDSAYSMATGFESSSIALGDWSCSYSSGDRANSVVNGSESYSISTGIMSTACALGASSMAHTKGESSSSYSFSYTLPSSKTEGDESHSVSIAMFGYAYSQTIGSSSHGVVIGPLGRCSAIGANSIACALGTASIARSSETGTIILVHYDHEAGGRHRVKVGYPGEDGIKPNTYYRLNDEGNFVECENEDVFI